MKTKKTSRMDKLWKQYFKLAKQEDICFSKKCGTLSQKADQLYNEKIKRCNKTKKNSKCTNDVQILPELINIRTQRDKCREIQCKKEHNKSTSYYYKVYTN
jgi:hypothetical protein